MRKHTLGHPKDVPFAKAREQASRLIAAAKVGDDPAGEIRQAKNEAKAAITIGELAQRYLAHQKRRVRPRTYEGLCRHLSPKTRFESRPRYGRPLDIRPLIERPAARITQGEIVKLLQDIAELAPVTANRVRANLSALYSWGMKAGLVPANPVAATFKPAEEKPRERVLSDKELVLIWHCTTGGADHDRIVRLLMLTGARRAEIAGMRWSELTSDEDGTISWLLPSDRSKNGRPNVLALPPFAVDQLPPRREVRELVFGEGAGPFSGWSQSKARLDQRMAKDGGQADWVLHDLRRTFVTRLNDLGVDPHVIEALVNHVGGVGRAGIAGIYNRSAYAAQKRAALELWCGHVARLTASKWLATAEKGHARCKD